MRRFHVLLAAGMLGLLGLTLIMYTQRADVAQQEGQQMRDAFDIGVKEDGIFVPLATLSFDDTNHGSLALGAPHGETAKLVEGWQATAVLDTVWYKTSRPITSEEGDDVYELIGLNVERDSDDYRDAVLAHLRREYGFYSR